MKAAHVALGWLAILSTAVVFGILYAAALLVGDDPQLVDLAFVTAALAVVTGVGWLLTLDDDR